MKQRLPIIILSSLLVIASGVIVYLVMTSTDQEPSVEREVVVEDQDSMEEQDAAEDQSVSEFSQYFDTGEVIWVGRDGVVEEPNGDIQFGEYELIKIVDGKEQVVFTGQAGPCSGAEWSTAYYGTLVFSHFTSPCEAFAEYDVRAFTKSGDESLRASYITPGSEVTFTPDNSYSHVMSLITSTDCSEGEVVFPEEGGPEIITQTEILGVKISSEDGVEEYLLDEPQTVTCGVTYGYGSVVDPHIYDIQFELWGFEFTLASGERARVRIDAPQGVVVEFPWQD